MIMFQAFNSFKFICHLSELHFFLIYTQMIQLIDVILELSIRNQSSALILKAVHNCRLSYAKSHELPCHVFFLFDTSQKVTVVNSANKHAYDQLEIQDWSLLQHSYSWNSIHIITKLVAQGNWKALYVYIYTYMYACICVCGNDTWKDIKSL